VVTRDDVAVGAAQPLPAHRERAVAAGLGDARLLEQRQRVAAGADEHEPRAHGALVAGGQVAHVDRPAGAVLAQIDDLVLEAQREAGRGVEPGEQAAGERAEVDVGAARHPGRRDRAIGGAAVHHQRHPLGELGAVLAVLEIGNSGEVASCRARARRNATSASPSTNDRCGTRRMNDG
jgi:hypothetical protein